MRGLLGSLAAAVLLAGCGGAKGGGSASPANTPSAGSDVERVVHDPRAQAAYVQGAIQATTSRMAQGNDVDAGELVPQSTSCEPGDAEHVFYCTQTLKQPANGGVNPDVQYLAYYDPDEDAKAVHAQPVTDPAGFCQRETPPRCAEDARRFGRVDLEALAAQGG